MNPSLSPLNTCQINSFSFCLFLLNEEPSTNLALPPVGLDNKSRAFITSDCCLSMTENSFYIETTWTFNIEEK